MAIVKRSSKLTAVLLIVSVFFTACEIPDISKFTEQSAEMTRGVRKGVKDTENVIKAAALRNDLYSAQTMAQLRRNLKDYQAAVKPTAEALDALDAYLEALNALAQANKKSEENSRAVVNAVGSLVTAVSGFTFATPVVNVAAGVTTLFEQFRTTRDFKKRVNLAAEIVEGVYPHVIDGKQVKDEKGQPVFLRTCKGDAENRITTQGTKIRKLYEAAIKKVEEKDVEELKPLTPTQRRARLRELGAFDEGELRQLKEAEDEIGSYRCGVIDLIKFNVRDVQRINDIVASTVLVDVTVKHRTVLGFYRSIDDNDRAIQRELQHMLNSKTVGALIREGEATGAGRASINQLKITLQNHLTGLFILDGALKLKVLNKIDECGAACGRMREYLLFDTSSSDEDTERRLLAIIDGIPTERFEHATGLIEPLLEERAAVLYEQNTRYLDDLERITPAHNAAMGEINAMRGQQRQLDTLLESSLSALDAWAETHANLRVAVNTKKPLTAAKLASKVREIWGIVNPETGESTAR